MSRDDAVELNEGLRGGRHRSILFMLTGISVYVNYIIPKIHGRDKQLGQTCRQVHRDGSQLN